MLNFREFDDKLVIKESLSRWWIFVVWLFILIWTWNVFSINEIVFGVIGVLSIIFVLFSISAATTNEIVINKKNRELTTYRKSFFSFNTKYHIYKFDALSETIEFESRKVGKSEEYFAYVKTLDNKKIELFDSGSSKEETFFKLFKLSNQYFIGLSSNDFQLPIT